MIVELTIILEDNNFNREEKKISLSFDHKVIHNRKISNRFPPEKLAYSLDGKHPVLLLHASLDGKHPVL